MFKTATFITVYVLLYNKKNQGHNSIFGIREGSYSIFKPEHLVLH